MSARYKLEWVSNHNVFNGTAARNLIDTPVNEEGSLAEVVSLYEIRDFVTSAAPAAREFVGRREDNEVAYELDLDLEYPDFILG